MNEIRDYIRAHRRNFAVAVIYICLFILIVLAIQALNKIESSQQEGIRTSEHVAELVSAYKELAEDNKKLAEDNVYLADRNIYYSKCHLRIWAKWTRDQQPVTIKDIGKCEFSTRDGRSSSQPFNPTGNSKRQTPVSDPSNPPKPSNNSNPPNTPNNPQNPSQPPSSNDEALLNCRIDIFGIHLFCPKVET